MTSTEQIQAATALLADPLHGVASLGDAELLALQTALGDLSHVVARHAAAAAGELARRSSRELGYAGLAQSSGHRTPEALLQSVSGVTSAEASQLVRVGSLPKTSPLAAAVASGQLSVPAADAIRRGLRSPNENTSAQALDEAARTLIATARSVTPDSAPGTPDSTRSARPIAPEQLYRAAADARAALDLAGVADRETARRELRYARIRRREDGMVAGSFLLDQEDGTLLLSAIDTILSPRRGGPRFVSAEDRARADAIIADPRSNDQLAADALADMIRLAVDADPGTLYGDRRPAVQVIVTASDLAAGIGAAHLEGAPEPVSIHTARRHACNTGLIGILFNSQGQPLDVGRAQRPFTFRQRIALAARDGGCRFPGCTRPPSWCEAHHVKHWHRDRGRTDVENGLLLCRHHHLLIHNNGWEIERSGASYYLIPPRAVDPEQQPIPMPSKSRVMTSVARDAALERTAELLPA